MPKPIQLSDLPPEYQRQAQKQIQEDMQRKGALEPPLPASKKKCATPENDLQDIVMADLEAAGYMRAHFRPAKVMRGGKETYRTPVQGDGTGFPDIIAVKDGRMLVLELKSETGKVRPEQLNWLRTMRDVPGTTVLVVRPGTWNDLRSLL